MGALTPLPIPVVSFQMSYDFRVSNSYIPPSGFGLGQKQIAMGTWAMFAGEGTQLDPFSYDINGSDKIFWTMNNGVFGVYNTADYDLSGDVSGSDKTIWTPNNGVFSGVPKPQYEEP